MYKMTIRLASKLQALFFGVNFRLNQPDIMGCGIGKLVGVLTDGCVPTRHDMRKQCFVRLRGNENMTEQFGRPLTDRCLTTDHQWTQAVAYYVRAFSSLIVRPVRSLHESGPRLNDESQVDAKSHV